MLMKKQPGGGGPCCSSKQGEAAAVLERSLTKGPPQLGLYQRRGLQVSGGWWGVRGMAGESQGTHLEEEALVVAASKVRQAVLTGVLSVQGLVVAPTGEVATAGGGGGRKRRRTSSLKRRPLPQQQAIGGQTYIYSHTRSAAHCVSSGISAC
jgi:hypothetical protein